MNSNLKFRVWCVSAKYWDNQILETRPITRILESTDYIAQQWTGLFDKNNARIFEGDIVEYLPPVSGSMNYPHGKGNEAQILFINDEKRTFGWYVQHKSYCWTLHPIFCAEHLTVVGNILENPELLQK
jgi:uncharacterized phage protein (TIGR01671 family)